MLLSVFDCVNFVNRAPTESVAGPEDWAKVPNEVVMNKKEMIIDECLVLKLARIIDFKFPKSTIENNQFGSLLVC
jgi:hypothetical protein